MPGPEDVLPVGAAAPDFELDGTAGPVALRALLEKGPVALFFYPGNNTPGWNRQLSAVRDEQTEYRKHKVTTMGVNPASVASHERYADAFAFGFPLLSDPERSVSRAYHALKPDGKGILRTVYLIGTDGKVRFAQRGAPPSDAILASLG